MSVTKKELNIFLNKLLRPHEFSDYGPNGLQIDGKENISKIAFAVSATRESINQAIIEKSDCLIVHHGLFWNFHGVKTLTGPFYKRVFPLIKNEVSLFAHHLPLDAHLEIGNAAAIAKRLELEAIAPFGDYKGSPVGVMAKFKTPITSNTLIEKLEGILDHNILHSCPCDKKEIQSIGIITGGANGDWTHCLKNNLDAYLTGEMSEHDWHEAREAGIHMFAGGHNATEQFGIQELMHSIKNSFKVETIYIPSENPA